MAPTTQNASTGNNSYRNQNSAQAAGSTCAPLSLPASRRSIFKLNKHGQLKFVPRIKKPTKKGVSRPKMLGPSKLCYDASHQLSPEALKALYDAQAKRVSLKPPQAQKASEIEPATNQHQLQQQQEQQDSLTTFQLQPEDLLVFPIFLHPPLSPTRQESRPTPVPKKALPKTAKVYILKVQSALSPAEFVEFYQAVKRAGQTPFDQKAIHALKTSSFWLLRHHTDLLDELEQFLPEECRSAEYVEPVEEEEKEFLLEYRNKDLAEESEKSIPAS